MSIIKQGPVEKCGPKRMPTWHRRWLVLYSTQVLEYFKTDQKAELKGHIELSGNEVINTSGDSGKTLTCGFYLETKERTYKFAVSSTTEKEEWCRLMTQVIHGHIRRPKKSKSNASLDLSALHRQKKTKTRTLSNAPNKKPNKHRFERAFSSPLRPKHNKIAMYSGAPSGELKEDYDEDDDGDDSGNSLTPNNNENDDNLNGTQDIHKVDEEEESKSKSASNINVNGSVALFNLDHDHNYDLLLRIVDFLYMQKHEFAKLFVVCKLLREIVINNGYFFRHYTIHVYPRHILSRFSATRSGHHRWILNHWDRTIWIFGLVEHFKYNSARLRLKPYFGPICNKLFLDDVSVWNTSAAQIDDMLSYVEYISRNVRYMHIRSYSRDEMTEHDEHDNANQALLENLPSLPLVDCVRFDFSFHHSVFHKQCINPYHLVFFELHSVDLIADDSADDISLRILFKQLTSLLVLIIEHSRWKNRIVLPPQLKFFRFKPSDLSIVDMSRIADKSDTSHNLPFKINWPCDMLIDHTNWPSVMNQYIMAGHDALQNKKLRIWVLRHLRKWDAILMNVNYIDLPPPFELFKKSKCFKKLTHLDQNHDMSRVWTSAKSEYWRNEPT